MHVVISEQTQHLLEVALERLGINPTPEVLEQLEVFLKALAIYDERSAPYGDVWKQYGALNNLVRGATKVDRLMEVWWHNPDGGKALGKDGLDDAYDALNYMAFFARLVVQGNVSGSGPERREPVVIRAWGEPEDAPLVPLRPNGKEHLSECFLLNHPDHGHCTCDDYSDA